MGSRENAVVIGGGPVGLLLAIELTMGGARALVLEQLTAPNTDIKAVLVGPLGAEALARRGMGPALDAAEERIFDSPAARSIDLRARAKHFTRHFAFLPLRPEAIDEPERTPRLVDQAGIEAILAERAAGMGVEVRRGCELTGFDEDADGIEVRWTSPAGPGHARCGWLVGCDGGRSAVRRMAGIAFPGPPPSLTMYQALADLDHPERLDAGWQRTGNGLYAYGPFPRRLFVFDFDGPPADRAAPVTREEVEGKLRRISGRDVRVTGLEQATRWTDATRLADDYRRGRVLLAGDAAHVHPPFGGQGLSLGLTDAVNLGWKLAAVIRGEHPETLLDSYAAERRPVAEAVLGNTLAQVAILRPDASSGAMRELMRRTLMLDDVNRQVAGMMSGLAARYDLGSDRDEVGRRIEDRPLGDGATLFAQFAQGEGVLLDASPDGQLSALAAGVPRLRRIAVSSGPSLLIRPDACVAWAGEEERSAGFADALAAWFGREPAAAGSRCMRSS